MARFHIERFRKLVRTALALAIIGGPTACSRTGFSPPDARSRDHLPADSLPADSLAADRLPADARTGDHLPADSLAADAVAADTATTGDISPGADGSSFSLGPQSRIVNRLDSVTFSGTCTASVAVSGAETAVLGCSAGGWTFRATPVSTDGLRSFDFTSAGVTLSASWIRDTAPPRLVADGMQLSGGAGIARSHFASVTLAAEDDESSVVAVCLALEPIAPAPEAACWVRVEDLPGAPAAGPAVALPQVPIRLGFAPGFYDIYAWVQDEAGNSSSLTNAGAGTSGLDRLNALYVPLAPPSVQVLAATSTDSPTAPPSQQQLSVLPGASLYIKWAAQDDEPLGARPIEVAYTTDDLHYTTIASALVNGANGACTPDAPNTTADDGATGCFLWQGGAPSAGFFRVRVIATDANGTSSAAVSTPLNTNAVRFLAGNIDLGTDTSANAATFVNVPRPVRDFGDPGSFVVLTDGRFFFRDAIRGLLVVDPRDGVQRIFIPTTGTASGDGGPAASATLRLPHRIALDHRQRILIFDYDRIRRVDTTVDPPTIETVIGGGSQADDGVRATEVAIDPPVVGDTLAPTYTQQMPLFALPNGDIYFQSNNYQAPPASGGRFRILRAATGRVQSLVVSGLDTQLTPGQDLALCSIGWLGVSYDLQSSVITHAQVVQEQTTVPTCATLAEDAMTRIEIASGIATPPHPGGLGGYLVRLIFPIQGMDGRLYALSRHRSMILVFDEAQNAFTPIVGTNELGSCPDGTAALSCDIDPSDVFVTRRGQLYFMERGLLRALDQRGNVVTVMGQPLSFGDGGAPLLARIHEVANLATRESGGRLKIVFLDGKQFRFREVSEGLSIDTIAGNGSNRTPALGAAAAAEPLLLDGGGVAWTHFGLDQGTGTVVFNRGFDRVAKLDRATGQWRDLVGGGTVPYLDADGQLGAAIALRDKNAYLPSVLALDGTDILVATEVYNETVRALEDIVIKTHRFADGRQGHLVGGRGLAANGYCADGTAVDLCLIPAARYQLRARREGPKSWLVGRPDTNSLYLVDAQAVNRYVLLPRGPTAFDVDLQGAFPVLYYCAAGKLYRYRMADSTETQLALPHPNMRCSGQGLDFVASRRSLVFGFSLHSLGGIAEYLGL